MIGNFSKLSGLAAIAPGVYNAMVNNSFTGGLIRKFAGFAAKRSLPGLHSITLRKWFYEKWPKEKQGAAGNKKVYLFCDEFTNYNDTTIGIKAVQLLHRLGYDVQMAEHPESARAYMSKGLLRKAREYADRNVRIFSDVISENVPLLGVEPSAILSFRDEYPDLVSEGLRDKAKALAKNVFLIDEFIAAEADKGHITSKQFTTEKQHIKLHGHCQQKALSSALHSQKMLSLPQNYSVEVIPSGCCGMAGSFGYEKEHYDISMQIGELVLFPAVRNAAQGTLIAAPGTSCRHQVKDGTGVKALHPVEILYNSLV